MATIGVFDEGGGEPRNPVRSKNRIVGRWWAESEVLLS